jgi:hypothetical protein
MAKVVLTKEQNVVVLFYRPSTVAGFFWDVAKSIRHVLAQVRNKTNTFFSTHLAGIS